MIFRRLIILLSKVKPGKTMSAEEGKKGRLESFIARFYKFGIFLAVLLVLGAFVTDILTNNLYIKDIDAQQIQDKLSIDDDEMNNRLKDEMDHIYHMANSLKESHPNLSATANPFSVDVGGVSTSYFTLVDFVKYKLGLPYYGISATIYADGNKHIYRSRIGSHMIEKKAMTFDSTYDVVEIFDTLMHQMALGIVAYTDPYIAAMYHYKRGEHEPCLKLAKEALENDPGARKFALGTIANTYKEMGKYAEAETHYRRCIEEFPKFWAAYWRYGQLQEEMGRYEEAEENYLITYRKDKRLEKTILRSLLALTCRQEEQAKFASFKEAFLRKWEMEDLRSTPGIAPCL